MKMVHKLRNADYMTKVLYSYNIFYFIFILQRELTRILENSLQAAEFEVSLFLLLSLIIIILILLLYCY